MSYRMRFSIHIRAVLNQCAELRLIRTMGTTRSCYDHASAKPYWSIFMHEYYDRHTFTTLDELTGRINKFGHRYNTTIRYSHTGQIGSIDYARALALAARSRNYLSTPIGKPQTFNLNVGNVSLNFKPESALIAGTKHKIEFR